MHSKSCWYAKEICRVSGADDVAASFAGLDHDVLKERIFCMQTKLTARPFIGDTMSTSPRTRLPTCLRNINAIQ